MSSKEKFNQISPSEFFYRNRDLAGFSNPTRSLYTAVREFVENGLDACDQQGILPDIHLSIKAVDPEAQDPKQYILTVKDNGPGIDAKHVPLAFGTVLYGSKFGLKQARGMFGLGATMAILYGQITTNRPVTVKSSTDGKIRHEFDILLDIQKNKPVILKKSSRNIAKKGLSVSICLEGDYSKAGSRIRDYVYQTSLITPYATMTFEDPKGQKFRYARIIDAMPKPPTIINPHPHGVDVETIRRMMADAVFEIPTVDDKLVDKMKKELKLRGNQPLDAIMKKVSKKWKNLTRNVRLAAALMFFTGLDFEQIGKIRVEDVDAANSVLAYWDFGKSASASVQMDPASIYYKQIANTVMGETLTAFLTKRFQRVGKGTAVKFARFARFRPEKRLGSMSNQELVRLSDALQKFEGFMPPDPSCLAPLGAEPLEAGIKKFFEADFTAVVQRMPSAYSGFPFVVEMGIAYGGKIQAGGIDVLRFANRIPLLYDEGSDVVLKIVNELDWNRYKVKDSSAPMVIVSHICSTRIPYKTVGKENVADRPEIEREIRLALLFLSRKLSSYMSRKGQAEAAKKRADLYAKYIPLIAQFSTELSGQDAEPDYKKILEAGADGKE